MWKRNSQKQVRKRKECCNASENPDQNESFYYSLIAKHCQLSFVIFFFSSEQNRTTAEMNLMLKILQRIFYNSVK